MLLGLTKLYGLDEWFLCTPKDTHSWSQRSKRRYYLKFQDVDWKRLTKLILKDYTVRMRLKFIRLGIGANNGFCKRCGTSRLSQLTLKYFFNVDFDLLTSLFSYWYYYLVNQLSVCRSSDTITQLSSECDKNAYCVFSLV